MDSDSSFSEQRLRELTHQWEKEEITIEQLNGQMLVWIEYLYKATLPYERDLDGIYHSLADLDVRVQKLEEQLV